MGIFGKKKEKTVAEAPAAVPAAEEKKAAESGELVAVLTAAIAAYEAEQYRQTLYIRKIDRTAGVRPVWGVTGANEAIDVRRM